jgi:hypothetical protein
MNNKTKARINVYQGSPWQWKYSRFCTLFGGPRQDLGLADTVSTPCSVVFRVKFGVLAVMVHCNSAWISGALGFVGLIELSRGINKRESR